MSNTNSTVTTATKRVSMNPITPGVTTFGSPSKPGTGTGVGKEVAATRAAIA